MPTEALSFEVDERELRRHLVLVPKQVPYALALSLTRTLKGAQATTLAEEPKHLTIRTDYLTRPSSPGYFRVVPAKKDLLEGVLGTRAPLMEQEVFGGVKPPGKASLQTVPAKGGSVQEPLRGEDNLGTLMRRDGKWAKKIVKTPGGGYFLKRVKAFAGKESKTIATGKMGETRTHKGKTSPILKGVADKDILFQRIGPLHAAAHGYMGLPAGRMVRPQYPIQAVYIFTRGSKIPALFPFQRIVEVAVGRLWPKVVEAAVNEALWTAK
jgi:hypothetical protein